MWNSLIDSEPTGEVLTAWIAKEELRALLKLARTDASRDQIARALHRFYAWCAEADIDELTTLATTVETWWPAIEAFLATGITNARTEGINRLIKQVKRSACGFRNPANGHRRIRFHCTRTARAATAATRSLPAQSWKSPHTTLKVVAADAVRSNTSIGEASVSSPPPDSSAHESMVSVLSGISA